MEITRQHAIVARLGPKSFKVMYASGLVPFSGNENWVVYGPFTPITKTVIMALNHEYFIHTRKIKIVTNKEFNNLASELNPTFKLDRQW